MNENKFDFGDGRVLEHNEKCLKDTLQMFDNVTEEASDIQINRYKEDPESHRFGNIFFKEGKELWLKVTVMDSLMSCLLYDWLNCRSKFDDTQGLHVMGCKLNTIYFNKPGFSDEDREAIKHLYNTVIGNLPT